MPLLTVTIKEVLENLRDKCSLASALLGPALMPLFMIGMIHFSLEQNISKPEEKLSMHISGMHHASNLVQQLKQNNFQLLPIALEKKEI